MVRVKIVGVPQLEISCSLYFGTDIEDLEVMVACVAPIWFLDTRVRISHIKPIHSPFPLISISHDALLTLWLVPKEDQAIHPLARFIPQNTARPSWRWQGGPDMKGVDAIGKPVTYRVEASSLLCCFSNCLGREPCQHWVLLAGRPIASYPIRVSPDALLLPNCDPRLTDMLRKPFPQSVSYVSRS